MTAAVLVSLGFGMTAASVCGLVGFRQWLAFRREGQKHDSAAVADVLKRLKDLEEKMTAAELAKLRR